MKKIKIVLSVDNANILQRILSRLDINDQNDSEVIENLNDLLQGELFGKDSSFPTYVETVDDSDESSLEDVDEDDDKFEDENEDDDLFHEDEDEEYEDKKATRVFLSGSLFNLYSLKLTQSEYARKLVFKRGRNSLYVHVIGDRALKKDNEVMHEVMQSIPVKTMYFDFKDRTVSFNSETVFVLTRDSARQFKRDFNLTSDVLYKFN